MASSRRCAGLLLYPPGVCPANPYASLPALAGWLRHHDVDVDLRDLNVEAYDAWLSDSRDVTEAKAFMRGRTGDFFNAREYSEHHAVLRDALELFSARYEGAAVSLGGYRREMPSLDRSSVEDVLREGRDPVVDFLDAAMPSEDFDRYGWIGISMAFDPQLVPALLTAAWLRRHGYEGRIVLGGACAQFVKDVFEAHPDLFDIVDALIVMEGESALTTLAAEPSVPVHALPNAITRRADGMVSATGPHHIEEYRAAPAPDYAGLPLDLYLSPSPALLVATSRGCYYNKCAFCVPSFGRDEGYRAKTPRHVAADLHGLRTSIGTRYLFFSDDCIPPKYLTQLWDIYGRDGDWAWQTEIRFEPGLTFDVLKRLKASGCEQLIFGFESANQRVLDQMAKGTRRNEVDRILRDCEGVGINANLQTMIGFPTETVDEALETFRYLVDQQERVASFSMGHFQLLDRTPIVAAPARFGLRQLRPEKYGSLYSYEPDRGLSSRQASALSESFYAELQEAYPVNRFFLDGPIGTHALAYAGRGLLRDLVGRATRENRPELVSPTP